MTIDSLTSPLVQRGINHCVTHRRRALLIAALAALRVRNLDAPELRHVHALLDSWRGTGLVVVGMERHGFQVSLGDHGSGQWIAVFYRGSGGHQRIEAAGTAQAGTPWEAVQRAAWEALRGLRHGI